MVFIYTGVPYKQASMPVKEWMCQQGEGQEGKEQKLPSVFLSRLLAEAMVHFKGMSFCLQVWNKDVCLPTSRSGSKSCVFLSQRSALEVDSPPSKQSENLSGVPSISGLQFISDMVKLTIRNSNYSQLPIFILFCELELIALYFLLL